MSELEFLKPAEEEYQDAYAWYYARNEQAAVRFENAVELALRRIAEAPHRWALCDETHHVHIVDRFPYHIVYRVEHGRVYVVAVAHARRKPGYWERRD